MYSYFSHGIKSRDHLTIVECYSLSSLKPDVHYNDLRSSLNFEILALVLLIFIRFALDLSLCEIIDAKLTIKCLPVDIVYVYSLPVTI